MSVLTKIQSELKAPKSQYNSFGKYYYRTLSDIDKALKPLLVKYEAEVHLSDDIVEVGGRVYVKATATFKSKEETITVTAFAREDESKKGMDGAQVTGGASSYARKYALNGLFLIDDTADIDSDEYQKQGNSKQSQAPRNSNKQTSQQNHQAQGNQQQGQPQYISQEQYNEIELGINQLAAVKQTITSPIFNFYLEKFKVSDFHALTIEQHQTLMKHINNQIAKAQAKQ